MGSVSDNYLRGDQFMNKSVSSHYLEEEGERYLKVFDGLDIGRLYQCKKYFFKYCSDESVIIDLGCADGFFLANLPAKRRIGVEANPASRSRIKDTETQFGVTIETFDSLEDVPSGVADIAISNHCLEHILTPLEVLRELRRVLKAHARFVLVVPFDDWRKGAHRTWRSGDVDNHLYTWSPQNLGNLLSEAGFKVDAVSVITGAWHPRFFWILRRLHPRAFAIACYIFGIISNRREILAVVQVPGAPTNG